MGGLRDRVFDWAHYGERPVLVQGDRVLDAPALARAVEAAVGGLVQLGVQPGDRVAWLGPTAVETIVGLLAVGKVGAIAVPLNPRHTHGELEHVIEDSEAALVVLDPALGERSLARGRCVSTSAVLGGTAIDSLDVARDDEDPALLIYTSGTTGRSKGAALPWRAVVSNMDALGRAWGLGPHDRCPLMLPLFHVHGLCIGVFAMLLAGVTIQLHGRFDCEALVEDIRAGATVWLAVPTMYTLLLDHLQGHPEDAAVLARARLFTSGSAPLAVRDFERFERATGHRILERYGMTETLITLTNPIHGDRLPGHVGDVVPGVHCRIVDDAGAPVPDGEPGELQIRGDALMLGYWRNPSATAASMTDGWFRTGDVAQRGNRGAIRIVGRTSTDIIKSGGFKVSALEIEDALRDVASVVDVAVLGVDDAKWGERIAAVLVLAGTPPLDVAIAELEAHCRGRLADYKQPRMWLVVDALPRNAMGKLGKPQLRQQLAALAPFVSLDHRAASGQAPAGPASSGRPPA